MTEVFEQRIGEIQDKYVEKGYSLGEFVMTVDEKIGGTNVTVREVAQYVANFGASFSPGDDGSGDSLAVRFTDAIHGSWDSKGHRIEIDEAFYAYCQFGLDKGEYALGWPDIAPVDCEVVARKRSPERALEFILKSLSEWRSEFYEEGLK